jgi:TRAP-type C4-dicarboxylate transport system permease small subunit
VLARAGSNVVEGLLLLMMVVLCADVFLGVFSRYVIGRTFT